MCGKKASSLAIDPESTRMRATASTVNTRRLGLQISFRLSICVCFPPYLFSASCPPSFAPFPPTHTCAIVLGNTLGRLFPAPALYLTVPLLTPWSFAGVKMPHHGTCPTRSMTHPLRFLWYARGYRWGASALSVR